MTPADARRASAYLVRARCLCLDGAQSIVSLHAAFNLDVQIVSYLHTAICRWTSVDYLKASNRSRIYPQKRAAMSEGRQNITTH